MTSKLQELGITEEDYGYLQNGFKQAVEMGRIKEMPDFI
jgi:hypothetical protein